MSIIFLYKDRQGKIYGQSGHDAVDMVEDANPYRLETVTNVRYYYESLGPEQALLIKDLDTRMEDMVREGALQ